MRRFVLPLLTVCVLSLFSLGSNCRQRNSDAVTVALPEKFSSFDTLMSTSAPDAAAERIRTLIFNSLVRKNENFEYVGELASDIRASDDGMAITFILRDGVKFHDGSPFTSADVKYTFDELFKGDEKNHSFKSGAFFDTVPLDKTEASRSVASPSPASGANAKPSEEPKTRRVAHITSIETPDAKTVVFHISRPSLKNLLLSNFVAVPIIPQGTSAQVKDNPIGTGPFKFVNFDASQNIVDLAANTDYWDGAPKIAKLRVKTVTDASSLQAELQSGGVDIAPNPSNLPPDILKALSANPSLKLDQFDGSNIQYLIFNTQSAPLNNVKVRQAIGYAIDRQKIVTDLLADEAKVADSVVPTQSWAYSPGRKYNYDPAKARELLKDAGYKNESISFKYGSGNAATNQYAQVIQSSLNDIGLNVQIDTLEANVIRQQLAQGQFQMYTGAWIGGNTDPMFLKNLFSSTMIPNATTVPCCNRGRYSNAEVDKLLEQAVNATDPAVAKPLYSKTWDLISNDLPMLPLWYPANIVISNKRIANIKMSGSGDWGFLKDITVAQ